MIYEVTLTITGIITADNEEDARMIALDAAGEDNTLPDGGGFSVDYKSIKITKAVGY